LIIDLQLEADEIPGLSLYKRGIIGEISVGAYSDIESRCMCHRSTNKSKNE